jgi:hypothetical protein
VALQQYWQTVCKHCCMLTCLLSLSLHFLAVLFIFWDLPTWKITVLWNVTPYRVKTRYFILSFCSFCDFAYFLYVPCKIPIRTTLPGFYTILGGPHKNVNSGFCCSLKEIC